jgi:hypothetical protein
MNKELHLNVLMGTVSRYSVVTLVFFTTYIVFQPPSTVIIRYLGPRVHLSVIVTLWGAVVCILTALSITFILIFTR